MYMSAFRPLRNGVLAHRNTQSLPSANLCLWLKAVLLINFAHLQLPENMTQEQGRRRRDCFWYFDSNVYQSRLPCVLEYMSGLQFASAYICALDYNTLVHAIKLAKFLPVLQFVWRLRSVFALASFRNLRSTTFHVQWGVSQQKNVATTSRKTIRL